MSTDDLEEQIVAFEDYVRFVVVSCRIVEDDEIIGSRPSDYWFHSVCWFVCLFVCVEFFSAVFDPISIKLGHMLYVWV